MNMTFTLRIPRSSRRYHVFFMAHGTREQIWRMLTLHWSLQRSTDRMTDAVLCYIVINLDVCSVPRQQEDGFGISRSKPRYDWESLTVATSKKQSYTYHVTVPLPLRKLLIFTWSVLVWERKPQKEKLSN